MPKMSQQEIDWQSQEDAHTLARYEEIMQDNIRRNRAMKEANRQAKDLNKRANLLTKASQGKRK